MAPRSLASLFGASLILALPKPAHAQVLHHPYIEAGGPALLGSLNYELQPAPGFGIHAGAGAIPAFSKLLPIATFGASTWFGSDAHHIELGVGASIGLIDDADARFLVPTIGYRYQREDGGIVFRIGVTPLIRIHEMKETIPWGGASIGYAF